MAKKKAIVAEVARAMGVQTARVRRLLLDGRIRGATKYGRDWVIPVDAETGLPDIVPKATGRPPRKKRPPKKH